MITTIDYVLCPGLSQDAGNADAQCTRLEKNGWKLNGAVYTRHTDQVGIYQPEAFMDDVDSLCGGPFGLDRAGTSLWAVYIANKLGYMGVYAYRKGRFTDSYGLCERPDRVFEPVDAMSLFLARQEILYGWNDGEDKVNVPRKMLVVEEVCDCGSTWRNYICVNIGHEPSSMESKFACPCGMMYDTQTVINIEPVRLAGLGMAVPLPGIEEDY